MRKKNMAVQYNASSEKRFPRFERKRVGFSEKGATFFWHPWRGNAFRSAHFASAARAARPRKLFFKFEGKFRFPSPAVAVGSSGHLILAQNLL